MLCFVLLAAVGGTSLPARAAGNGSTALEEAKTLLASTDHDQVEAGIQGLGLIGTAEAVVPILERIRQGLPPDLLDTAILTLMALGQSHAAPVLFDLTSHRRPEIRIHAIEAIVAIAPKGAEDALRKALSDQDPKVRSAAATGLGELKATGSVDVLFQALDHGNMEASTAIGKILKPGDVQRLLGYLGKIPFRSLGPALAEVLKRKDISERDKLQIVGRLQDVGTPEVKTYLGDFLHGAGDSISSSLSRAILKSMQEIAN
ncbi:MAG TPA: HEAT repeat domain-containing protein [Polyangiales bacterium]|nr:HEAT repeat domain-containing protein [Polyangiales bacterium]